jgi:Protein of unknown function (DUF3187)
MQGVKRSMACATILTGCGFGAVAAHADPLLTRNQHALTTLFGLPSPLASRLPDRGGGSASLTLNWSSFASKEDGGPLSATLDGEVIDLRARVDHSLAPRWAWQAELAWRDLSGGTLDSLVDNWHDLFGLGGGSRNRLPQDQLLIEYVVDGVTRLRVDQDGSGIGDIPLSLGYQLTASETSAVATWLTVKLPTGDSERLGGSGAVDIAVTLSASKAIAESWQLFGQASLAWLGEGDVLSELQEDYVGSIMAGVSWHATPRFELTGQLEANTAVLDTGTKLDGDAVVLTLGGAFSTRGGWRFDLGFSEDLVSKASPDFVLIVGVGKAF